MAVLITSLACGSAGSTATSVLAPAVSSATLDAYVDRELAPHLPALAVGVITRDGLAWHRTAGSRDGRGGPAPERRSLFRLGSVTKVFTGIAVMQLRLRTYAFV